MYFNYYASSGLFHGSIPDIMHTRLDVLLFGKDEQLLYEAWSDMATETRRLEKMLNRFSADSEVARINSDAPFSPVELSDELWEMVLDCREYFLKTNGDFDITLSDFDKLDIVESSHSVQFDKYGMQMDFGGMAKGYALKKMKNTVKRRNIQKALVNFGNSSVLAVGSHPHGSSWNIGINNPFDNKPMTVFYLCDTSMSVSGNSPQNKRHIYNKDNTCIAENKIAAAVTENPVDAEVITTAWIASREEKPVWLERFEIKNKYSGIC